MRPGLQAGLAAAAASAPAAAGLAWNSLAAVPLPGIAILGLVLAGSAAVALLWVREMRRLAAGETVWVPAHADLAARLDRAGTEAAASARLAEDRAAATFTLFDALPEPVLLLDAAGGLVRANRAAEAAFGAAGEVPALLRHPALLESLRRAEALRAPQQVAIALSVPIERLLAVWIAPIGAAGGILGAASSILVLHDRTREAGVERMRADFIANASHELRTPLTSLIGFIETLRGPAEGDAEAGRRFLAVMHDQAGRMRRLLDDLLSLSAIELVEHAPPTGSVDAGQLVRRVAEEMGPNLAARRQTLALDIGIGLPSIPGDHDQLAQVVVNLMDNAVKYGREGGTVRASVRRVAPASGLDRGARRAGIAIVVEDDGAGIGPEHMPRLTERFYRVDAGRSRAIGGTGLGLAIVKHIVNRHRGRLEIDSTPGKGSCFTVWLPQA
ncbi:MAG: PAS domain-containing protein [Acetobacteraceae bacterium]|nr:PAS domain-containing protein [Acetobacteraceae bacterium]